MARKDIYGMTVKDILDLLEKRHITNIETIEETLQTSGPDPNHNKYSEFLTKRKNGQAKS
jgi:hypothetical protein